MNMKLTRQLYCVDGIFGVLTDESDNFVAVTLEHAFPDGMGGFKADVPIGVYTCKRGTHHLEKVFKPVETFEITDVAGHTGILFHVGNFNEDSKGCVLLGESRHGIDDMVMILQSRTAFEKFMEIQSGVQEFTLEIST